MSRDEWSRRSASLDFSLEALSALERIEGEAYFHVVSSATKETSESLGLGFRRLGGGVVGAMQDAPAGGFWNRAVGFSVQKEISEETLLDILEVFANRRCSIGILQFPARTFPSSWDRLREEHGLTMGSSWIKLVRKCAPISRIPASPRARQVTPEEYEQWAATFCAGFGVSDPRIELMLIGALHAKPVKFVGFAVWSGSTMIAAASVFIDEAAASLSGASTRPEYRHLGAHQALLTERIHYASAEGISLISSETENNPNAADSYNNLRKADFEVVGQRRNWIWRSKTR